MELGYSEIARQELFSPSHAPQDLSHRNELGHWVPQTNDAFREAIFGYVCLRPGADASEIVRVLGNPYPSINPVHADLSWLVAGGRLVKDGQGKALGYFPATSEWDADARKMYIETKAEPLRKILGYVAINEPVLSQAEMMKELHLAKSTVTVNLRKLGENGYVLTSNDSIILVRERYGRLRDIWTRAGIDPTVYEKTRTANYWQKTNTDAREAVYQHVLAFPGSTNGDVSKGTERSPQTTHFQLSALVAMERLSKHGKGKVASYFPLDWTVDEKDLFLETRIESVRHLLGYMASRMHRGKKREIVKTSGMPQTTAWLAMQYLLERGFVEERGGDIVLVDELYDRHADLLRKARSDPAKYEHQALAESENESVVTVKDLLSRIKKTSAVLQDDLETPDEVKKDLASIFPQKSADPVIVKKRKADPEPLAIQGFFSKTRKG